ncbi:MAG: methyltransferase domain-containing protein [Burkholderiaceae bacterium]
MAVSDYISFLREWMRNPKSVAAVSPSSPALAALITSRINADTGPVLELGPGTGSFTRELIKHGVKEHDLTLIETSRIFAHQLQERFPTATILRMDAARIAETPLLNRGEIGAVVCGLGLLNMPVTAIEKIVEGGISVLRPGGQFFLFTYGPKCSIPDVVLERFGLEATRIGKALLNIPPATVYSIHRKQGSNHSIACAVPACLNEIKITEPLHDTERSVL